MSHHPSEPTLSTPLEEASGFTHTHLEAGPHLRLASSPPPTAEDARRAEEISRAALRVLGKYRDYRVALQDGYQILAPDVPQAEYHFINYREALQNMEQVDPTRPTALLYKKVPGGYDWVGVMYSAPGNAGETSLDERYPRSMGQWHAHVNVCLPPDRMDWMKIIDDPEFGLQGSIVSVDECAAAGGTFLPDLFGWMVHVDLLEDR